MNQEGTRDLRWWRIPFDPAIGHLADLVEGGREGPHAQRGHARYLARRGAHCVITVKGNQPGLRAQLAALPWRDVPAAYDRWERGHGRRERRILKVTAVARGLAFPHAAQALQITRRRTVKGKRSGETGYAVTSLTATQATPGQLAAIIRGHWGIEDRLHWIRDIDFDEDRSQVRTAAGPQIMASLRNLAITILRLAGHASIAAALRYHARRPARPLQTIMRC
jgi:predicted transposase YbfD/YdcC